MYKHWLKSFFLELGPFNLCSVCHSFQKLADVYPYCTNYMEHSPVKANMFERGSDIYLHNLSCWDIK